jgi:hypothetical protein
MVDSELLGEGDDAISIDSRMRVWELLIPCTDENNSTLVGPERSQDRDLAALQASEKVLENQH